jgi:hypothetical protein
MKKQILSEELNRMKQLAGLINESEDRFSEYSNDALTDMIINLSRFENNEEDIQDVKDELARRRGDIQEGVELKTLLDMQVGETIKLSSPQDLAPFNMKLDPSGQAMSDLPELKGRVFDYKGSSISRLK